MLAGLTAGGFGGAPTPAMADRVSGATPKGAGRPVELEGELRVVFEDGEHDARLRHLLVEPHGRARALRFEGPAPQLVTGSRVRIRGMELPPENADSADGPVVVPCCSGGSVEVTVEGPFAPRFGEQRTIVLLVNFQNDTRQWFTAQDVAAEIFGPVSDHYRESSFGATWLSGRVEGWLTLPIDQTCSTEAIDAAGRAAAQRAGISLEGFHRIVWLFPGIGCGYAGSATWGGTPATVWLNGTVDLRVVVHEFGHNLGLAHSRSIDCGATSVGCATPTYGGDWIDSMDGGRAGHFNGFQKERLGWLPGGDVLAVASSGTYAIDVFELPSSAPKVLKIPKGLDPVSGGPSWYYLEYRQPWGFDNVLAEGTNWTSGILLRSGTDGDPDSSLWIDAHPSGTDVLDWNDAAIAFGETWSDPAAGISIQALAGDAGRATLTVTLAGGSGNPPPPPEPTNEVPVAVDDSGSTRAGQPLVLDVLANDSDPDGDPLDLVSVTQGSQGRVTPNADGTLTYAPTANAKGSDRFRYSVSDGLASASADVTVSLSPRKGRRK